MTPEQINETIAQVMPPKMKTACERLAALKVEAAGLSAKIAPISARLANNSSVSGLLTGADRYRLIAERAALSNRFDVLMAEVARLHSEVNAARPALVVAMLRAFDPEMSRAARRAIDAAAALEAAISDLDLLIAPINAAGGDITRAFRPPMLGVAAAAAHEILNEARTRAA